TSIGRSVINDGFPRFHGQLFFLHGPGFFYLEAGWERLLGSQSSLMSWIYQMRMLNALLAAASAVALVLLADRAGSLRAGAAAGLRWGPSRALTRLTLGATGLTYAVYLTVVAANGRLYAMWVAKTVGLKRMLGLIQATGFHSAGGGSLVTRLIEEGPSFATT